MPTQPFRNARLHRRHFLTLSAGAAMAAPLLGTRGAWAGMHDPVPAAADRAYRHLDTVMDAYDKGDSPRLLQSYNNESGLLTTAFVYDNALALLAYLARPTREHLHRARVIGDTFLWIQTHDERFTDGRVRQAYAAGPMLFFGGSPGFDGLVRADGHAAFLWPFGFSGTSTGDAAWVGLSLAALYAHTGVRRYLDGALALGRWIVTSTRSPYRHGGYLGGVQGDGVTGQRWASTEHNIDAYALFRLLADHTGDRSWYVRAEVARDFVHAMWNPVGGHFWTGTQGANPADDPDAVNRDVIPEDVNTWSWLSLGEPRYARSVDWVAAKLGNTDTAGGVRVGGVTFSDASKRLTGTVPNSSLPNDRSAVWLEGTAHLAAALRTRCRAGDGARADAYLRQIVVAQEHLGVGQTVGRTSDANGGRLSDPAGGGTWTGSPLPARCGISAASNAFDTGFGFGYFPNQHVGATSWFILAAAGINPYRPAALRAVRR